MSAVALSGDVPAPDFGPARAFLEALTGEIDPVVTFQTFSDVKPEAEKDPLARWLHGTLDQHVSALMRLNESGAGIFAMVNAGNGRGRDKASVVAVRAFSTDQDGPQKRPFALLPSFIVHTSPGKFHAFWRAAGDVPLEDFKPTQKRLIDYYGSDPNINDLPRVMRLPGFYHRKKEPCLVTFESGSGRMYTLDEIREAHPLPPKPSRRDKLIQIVREKAAERDWTEGNRHASAKATVTHGRKLGLDAEDIASVVVDLAERAGLPREEAEDIVTWTMANVAPDPDEAAPRAPTRAPTASSVEEPFPDPLAPEAFYGLAGEFVRIVSPHTEADEAALLAHFLVYFGNAVSRDPFYRVGATRHSTAENVVLVGTTSSARKGTAENETRRPFLLAGDVWTSRITTGLSSGEGLIHAVRDAVQTLAPIKSKGRITGTEAYTSDEGVQDKRLCVLEPEMARVLRVMERDGNTLSATVREAWDARDVLRTLTKNSPSVATGAHISIVGHITKDELLRGLDRTETANGFGNRFLWVAVKRSKFLPDGGSLRDGDLRPFVSKLRDVLGAARNVREMSRDADAAVAWHRAYAALEDERGGLFGAITARAAPHVLRLSMIYALMDGSAVIQEPHLAAALAFWAYCEDSARFVFGDATGDPEADVILLALRQTGRLSRTAISDLFSRNIPAQRLTAALALLDRVGKAHMTRETTGGRAAEYWAPGRCV